MRVLFLILCYTSLFSCDNKPATVKKVLESEVTFSDKYIICDTCMSTIIVHHDDCTFCGEISVDSGVLYLTSDVYNKSKILHKDLNSAESLYVPANLISVKELFFSDSGWFEKLWNDSLNNYNDSYKLVGRVVDVKRRDLGNGVIEEYPSLFFKVSNAEKLKLKPN